MYPSNTSVPHPHSLYILESTYRAYDALTQSYSRSIGMGLFTNINFYAGNIIAVFAGQHLLPSDFHIRRNAHRGDYGILTTDGHIMDCLSQQNTRFRTANMINSPHNVRCSVDDHIPSANAQISTMHLPLASSPPRLFVVATRTIPRDTEILMNYHPSYDFPAPSSIPTISQFSSRSNSVINLITPPETPPHTTIQSIHPHILPIQSNNVIQPEPMIDPEIFENLLEITTNESDHTPASQTPPDIIVTPMPPPQPPPVCIATSSSTVPTIPILHSSSSALSTTPSTLPFAVANYLVR